MEKSISKEPTVYVKNMHYMKNSTGILFQLANQKSYFPCTEIKLDTSKKSLSRLQENKITNRNRLTLEDNLIKGS